MADQEVAAGCRALSAAPWRTREKIAGVDPELRSEEAAHVAEQCPALPCDASQAAWLMLPCCPSILLTLPCSSAILKENPSGDSCKLFYTL